jgi:hypothetical protein
LWLYSETRQMPGKNVPSSRHAGSLPIAYDGEHIVGSDVHVYGPLRTERRGNARGGLAIGVERLATEADVQAA